MNRRRYLCLAGTGVASSFAGFLFESLEDIFSPLVEITFINLLGVIDVAVEIAAAGEVILEDSHELESLQDNKADSRVVDDEQHLALPELSDGWEIGFRVNNHEWYRYSSDQINHRQDECLYILAVHEFTEGNVGFARGFIDCPGDV